MPFFLNIALINGAKPTYRWCKLSGTGPVSCKRFATKVDGFNEGFPWSVFGAFVEPRKNPSIGEKC